MTKVKMYECENCGDVNTHRDSYDDRYCYDCIDIKTGELKKKTTNKTMERVLAISEDGNGLLPMKQGENQEKEKTDDKKNIETCNFIKNAFCIDGDVEMVLSNQAIVSRTFFRCNDSKRGKFWVTYGELNDAEQKDGE